MGVSRFAVGIQVYIPTQLLIRFAITVGMAQGVGQVSTVVTTVGGPREARSPCYQRIPRYEWPRGRQGEATGQGESWKHHPPQLSIMAVRWKKKYSVYVPLVSRSLSSHSPLSPLLETKETIFVRRILVRGNPLLLKIMTKHGGPINR